MVDILKMFEFCVANGYGGVDGELLHATVKDKDGNKFQRYHDCIIAFNNLADDAKLRVLRTCGVPSPVKV